MLFITQETELNLSQHISVVYFYAPWLVFHKKIYSLLQELEENFKKIKFYGVDVSQLEKCVNRFKVKSIPTIQIYDQGLLLKQVVGIQTIISAFEEKLSDIYEVYGDDNKELQ